MKSAAGSRRRRDLIPYRLPGLKMAGIHQLGKQVAEQEEDLAFLRSRGWLRVGAD